MEDEEEEELLAEAADVADVREEVAAAVVEDELAAAMRVTSQLSSTASTTASSSRRSVHRGGRSRTRRMIGASLIRQRLSRSGWPPPWSTGEVASERAASVSGIYADGLLAMCCAVV